MKFFVATSYIFVELDEENVDKMEVLGKMKLRNTTSTFTDGARVILNEAYIQLHENHFGSCTPATGNYWKLDFPRRFLVFNTHFSHRSKKHSNFNHVVKHSFDVYESENIASKLIICVLIEKITYIQPIHFAQKSFFHLTIRVR